MRRQMLATLMVAVAASGRATGQSPPEDAQLIAATRRFIPEVMQVYGVRGIEIAIARHGAVIWQGAQVRGAGAGRGQVWDEAGFRAGVDDLRHVAMQPDSIRAFLGSDRIRVWPEELNLIYAVLGGSRDYVPWPEFAPAH